MVNDKNGMIIVIPTISQAQRALDTQPPSARDNDAVSGELLLHVCVHPASQPQCVRRIRKAASPSRTRRNQGCGKELLKLSALHMFRHKRAKRVDLALNHCCIFRLFAQARRVGVSMDTSSMPGNEELQAGDAANWTPQLLASLAAGCWRAQPPALRGLTR